MAVSFFSSLKKERIRKRIYKTRDLARADIFDDIEVFYNRARRHSHLGGVSPEGLVVRTEFVYRRGVCPLAKFYKTQNISISYRYRSDSQCCDEGADAHNPDLRHRMPYMFINP